MVLMIVMVLVWIGVIIAGLYAGMELFMAVRYAESAPQQAAGAAMALAYVAIPYCIARAIQSLVTGAKLSSIDAQLGRIAESVKREEKVVTEEVAR